MAGPTRIEWGGFRWRVFHSTGHLGQEWDEGHVSVAPDGSLVILNTGDGVSGGVGMLDHDQVYGKWTVRFRMTKGCGKYCCVLWPDEGMRPEIDFAEDRKFDVDRTLTMATLHPTMSFKDSIQRTLKADFTKFHDLAVEWRKTYLRFSIDGKQWTEITEKIPTDPHHLNIQTAVFAPGPTSRMIVQSVKIEK